MFEIIVIPNVVRNQLKIKADFSYRRNDMAQQRTKS